MTAFDYSQTLAMPMPQSVQLQQPVIDPRMGVNPYSPVRMATPGSIASPDYMTANQGRALSALGVPASTGMTEQEAMRQTDVALAKLQAVNPQMAQQFMEMQSGQEGGGFLGFLKDVGSAIFAPFVSIGGRALEILGRTSHIVPQWFNPGDEGNFLEDIGQALSGEDKTNWNEVFQNTGFLKDAGWLRATIGFGLDIATDPLTYATLGAGAGLSAVQKGAYAGRAVATSEIFAKPLAAVLGKSADEATELLAAAWSRAGGAADNMAVVRKFADGGADELIAATGIQAKEEVSAVLADAFEAGSIAYQKVYGRTWKNFLAKNGEVTLSSGTVLRGGDLKPMFEAVARAGNYTKYGDDAWAAAKAAAGAMGGLRFRYAIPFSQFRYISPMVPGSWRLGMGSVARFGAGLSGFKQAEKLGVAESTLFAEKGWKGVQELASQGDEMAVRMAETMRAGRAPFPRAAFYTASEMAGQLTQHLSPGARMFRRGLGYYFAQNGIKAAEEMRRTLTNDLFYKIDPTASGSKVRSDLYRRFDKSWGPKATKTVEDLRDARRYVDYFGQKAIPRTDAEVAAGHLDDWFWRSRPDRIKAKADFDAAKAASATAVAPPEYVAQTAVLDDMKRILKKVRADDRVVLDDLVNTEAYGKTTLERHGVDVGDSTVNLDEARVLNPLDKPYLGERPGYLSQDFDVVLPSNVTPSAARSGGAGPGFSVAHEDLGVSGVRFDLTGGSKAGVKAQVRVQNVVDVNLEDFEDVTGAAAKSVIDGNASLPEILKAIDESFAKQGQDLAKHLHPALDNHILRLDWEASTRAELATEVLKRQTAAPEGVRFLRNGKPESMVIFDARRVHVMAEDAATLVPQGGYFRRVLSPQLKAMLGGEARKGNARIFGDPAALELSFRRQTRNMTLEEAERHIRQTINQSGGRYEGITVPETMDVFQWDVMKGHEEYIGYLGDSYFAVAMGRMTKRMLQLGQLVPGQFGAIASTSRVMFQSPAGRLAQLMRAEAKLQDTAIKLDARQSDEEARAWKTMAEQENRLATVLAYMEAGLRGEDVPAQQLSSAMDGVVRSSARLQEVIGEEIPRLEKKAEGLYEDLATTRKVHASMRVDEWDELDQFIDDHLQPIVEDLEDSLTVPALPSTARTWQRETATLRKAIAAGEAINVGPGMYKYKGQSVKVNGVELTGTTNYVHINNEGTVIAYRAVEEDGSVITMTASDFQRQGYGGKLILGHWADEGVTDFESVKRVVGPNTLSTDAIGLNKWAARKMLTQHGIVDPETIRDLLKRGELYTGKDGSILTKSGGIRKGGKRVRSIDDIEREIMEIDDAIVELNDLRKGVSRARYTHEVTFEEYEVMAARREAEAGDMRADSAESAERVDYRPKRADDTVADDLETRVGGHGVLEQNDTEFSDMMADVRRDQESVPGPEAQLEQEAILRFGIIKKDGQEFIREREGAGWHPDLRGPFASHEEAVAELTRLQEQRLEGLRRIRETRREAPAGEGMANNPRTLEEYAAAGGQVRLTVEDLVAYLKSRGLDEGSIELRSRGSRTTAKYPTEEDFTALVDKLRREGWDPSEPLTLAIAKGVTGDVYKTGEASVVDGTHRLLAAREAGLTDIPVDVQGALDYSNGWAWMQAHFPNAFPKRDVQAEQLARGGKDEAAEQAAQDDFAAMLFDAAGVAKPVTDTGGLTRAEFRAAARFQKAGDKAGGAVSKVLEREAKESLKRGKVQQRARARVTEAANELNRAKGQVEGLWAEMKPSVEFDLPPNGGKTMMREVQIPGLNNVYAHPYVAEEMEYLFKGKPVGHLRSMWREFLLGPWKRWATYRNPGFHVRNVFGAWFNNVLGGVDAADHEFARIIEMARGNKADWAATKVDAKYWKRYNLAHVAGLDGLQNQLTYGDVSDMLADMGVGRANTTSLAMTMGGEGLRDKARGRVGSVLAGIDSRLRNVGGLTEDFFRTAAWAGGMRHLDGDLYGARAFTMLRHGDYTDLTETEDFIRDLVPFYKWMRTNVPYQFRMMAENPGLLLAVSDKAQTYVYDVQGLNRQEQEKRMPDWMKKGFALPIPGDGAQKYILADLPYADLYNGTRDYLSSGLPLIRNIIESFGIQQSVYTGAPLGNHMVPLSGLWANPVVAPIIEAMPFAQKGQDGQTYIPDSIDNLLAAAPQYSRFRNWMLSDPDRVENRTATFTSALFGLGLRTEDATAAEQAFYYDELEPAMQRLRDMGATFPTVEDLQQAGYFYDTYGAQGTSDQLWPDGVAGTMNVLGGE